MPLYTPPRQWPGEDAYIIGGGPSLACFNWRLLAGKHVIGCNDAYRLGLERVPVCIFGDRSWFAKNITGLQDYSAKGGLVITNAPALLRSGYPWLQSMKRINYGLYSEDTLGWNYNTGAIAINLALSFGAARIFLLGFDMQQAGERIHWHDYNPTVIPDESFARFVKGYLRVAAELHEKFPGVSVVNVTDGSSRMPDCFPRQTFEEAFP